MVYYSNTITLSITFINYYIKVLSKIIIIKYFIIFLN